jgi:hypothetical protein
MLRTPHPGSSVRRGRRGVNSWDPRSIKSDENKATFFQGIKRFCSGPIRTKGRYVMVRTLPVGITGFRVQSDYVGYDEIVVRGGEFKPGEATVNTRNPHVPKPVGLTREAPGYAYSVLPFSEMFAEGPLVPGITPYSFLGEDECHLSVGGTCVIGYQGMAATTEPIVRRRTRDRQAAVGDLQSGRLPSPGINAPAGRPPGSGAPR